MLKKDRNLGKNVKAHLYITILLLGTCLLSLSCKTENDEPIENILAEFTTQEANLLTSLAPSDGSIVSWFYDNVSTQTQTDLQWQGFVISFTLGKEGDNFAIKYTTKLPPSLESTQEYQKVWPLTGYFTVSEISSREIQVKRFVYSSQEVTEDLAFSSGTITLSEDGNTASITFTIITPSSSSARIQGVPTSTWTFVLEKPSI